MGRKGKIAVASTLALVLVYFFVAPPLSLYIYLRMGWFGSEVRWLEFFYWPSAKLASVLPPYAEYCRWAADQFIGF